MNCFPPDQARTAGKMLEELREVALHADIVGRELPDNTLDDAAYLLWRSGLLNLLITRAANLHHPR